MGGTNVVSGLSSGIDWRDILDQLKAVEYKRVELIQDRRKTYTDRLSAWQTINTKLLAFKTAAGTLNKATGFNIYTTALSSNTATAAEDILSVTTDTDAVPGSYQIRVNSLAAAHKLSSYSYTSDTTALNLSGDLIVGGRTVTISATDTLTSLRDKINAVNTCDNPSKVTASIVHYGTTDHRLILTSDEEGAAGITVANGGAADLVGALGLRDERGVTGDRANTSGGVAITSATLIRNIDGYTTYQNNDRIFLTGTSTSGSAVNTTFTIRNATTVQELLTAIQTAYGQVTARVTSDGRLQVVDNEIGDTQLVVIATPEKPALRFDTDNNLGPISSIRTATVQAGANASFTVDGVAVTRSSNTVDDLIDGLTLNLRKAASDTTVTLTVGRDYEGIKEAVTGFVTAYNDVMNAINAQMKYNSDSGTTGGPLFGDSTLRAIKNDLVDRVINRVSGVDPDFSTLGIVGITLGNDSTLSIDDEKLQENLENNFNDVRRLFAADWSATNGALSYGYHTIDTKAGTYTVRITRTNPVGGYFVTPGDATGNGEYLTGISGDAKGLMIRYSGTATGNVGTFTLTYGIAELMDRALYHVTDSVDGTISNKTETIQDQIENIDESIQRLEDRIEQKLARLERQFIAMETALSTLQSQSSWLSSQLDSAANGWR
jgi:flagellar capping protein FliD